MQNSRPSAERKQPRLFYGWVIVIISFITVGLTFGVQSSFSVFYVAILEEFGWTRAATAGIFSLSLVTYMVACPISGSLIDRFGPRRLLPLAALLVTLGTFACSQANTLWHFYIFYGVITAIGVCAAGYVPHAAVLSKWFIKKRGTAFGIVTAGFSIAGLCVPFSQFLISHLGWRMAFIVLGSIVAIVLIPLTAIFQRFDPEEMGLLPDGATSSSMTSTSAERLVVDPKWASTEWSLANSIRTFRFWSLFVATILMWGVVIQVLLVHQVALVIDAGYSHIFAASIFGLYGVLGALGRLMGFVSDRISRETAVLVGTIPAIIGVGCLILVRDTSQPWLLYSYAICFGFGAGLIGPSFGSSVADIFQGKHFGSVQGFIEAGAGIGGSVGPWIAGYIFDTRDTYIPTLMIIILSLVGSCLLIWLTAPRRVRLVGGKAPP